MATIEQFFTYTFDYGNAGIQPQQTAWVSFGPSDVYKRGAVVITAQPDTLVAGAGGTPQMFAALETMETFVHVYPTIVGDTVNTDTHVGARIRNTGPAAIRYVYFTVAVIKA